MKKTLLPFCLLLTFSELIAQSNQYVNQSFEKEYQTITAVNVLEMTGDWQIGKPQKTIFNSAKTGLGVAMTDTSKPYSGNKLSQMTILLQKPIDTYFKVQFNHRLNINDGTDSAKIEFSFDKGTNWLDLVETQDYANCNGAGVTVDGFNLNGVNTTSNLDWSLASFAFRAPIITRIETCFHTSLFKLDSILVRFSFYSNTNKPIKEGWMIDDLELTIFRFLSGIESENSQNNTKLSLVPNPANGENVYLVSLDPNLQVRGWILEDMQGVQLKNQTNTTEIHTQNMQNGMYIVKVETDKGWYSKKLIVR